MHLLCFILNINLKRCIFKWSYYSIITSPERTNAGCLLTWKNLETWKSHGIWLIPWKVRENLKNTWKTWKGHGNSLIMGVIILQCNNGGEFSFKFNDVRIQSKCPFLIQVFTTRLDVCCVFFFSYRAISPVESGRKGKRQCVQIPRFIFTSQLWWQYIHAFIWFITQRVWFPWKWSRHLPRIWQHNWQSGTGLFPLLYERTCYIVHFFT